MLSDLGTYLTKAIPDTKLTIRRYADAKFAYLSYCLKVKEMDDEEHSYAALQEPIYRVETGNYEYRLILRCRQEARTKFARLRSDVLEKMELLESKHARDLARHLEKFIQGFSVLGHDIISRLEAHPNLFPVEVDLKSSAFQYKSVIGTHQYNEENKDDYVDDAQEINESFKAGTGSGLNNTSTTGNGNALATNNLIPGFEDMDLNAMNGSSANDDLLKELGIDGIDLSVTSSNLPLQQVDLLN